MTDPGKAITALSEFVSLTRPEDLPAGVVDRARTILLDTRGSLLAASAPRYLDRSVVDAAHLEAEKEIAANKARNEGKPDKIIPKIVEGMVQKFYKDVCLVDQPFVKDPNVSVGKMVQEAGRAIGKSVAIKRFVRFQVGEDTGAEA